jgi:hypothetical protein
MGAEPEVVTIVRLVVEGSGRVAGILEPVRSSEKRRFRDIEAIGPVIAAMLRGDGEGGEFPEARE